MPKKFKTYFSIKIFSITLVVIAIIGYLISVYTKLNFVAGFAIVLGAVLINGVVIDFLGDKDH